MNSSRPNALFLLIISIVSNIDHRFSTCPLIIHCMKANSKLQTCCILSTCQGLV